MLMERLVNDMKEAMRNKDTLRKNAITLLRAEIKQKEVDERRELSEADIEAVVQKQIRAREKAIIEFEKGDREDLVNEAKAEIDVLKTYLPEQLSEEEVLAVVKDAIQKHGKNMGAIMGMLKQELAGKADMGKANAMVRQELEKE